MDFAQSENKNFSSEKLFVYHSTLCFKVKKNLNKERRKKDLLKLLELL